MVQTDVLTGLANRRSFEAALNGEWRRAIREQTAVSMLMIDIDFFKGFNDRYGHPAGDACLRAVAHALADQVQRPADLTARLGGEEFGILLPLTDETGALQVAERVRASVAGLQFAHESSELGYVTVSVGVATQRPYDAESLSLDLVCAADRALYEAKAAGRNAIRSSKRAGLARVLA